MLNFDCFNLSSLASLNPACNYGAIKPQCLPPIRNIGELVCSKSTFAVVGCCDGNGPKRNSPTFIVSSGPPNRHAGMRQSGGYYPQWLRSNQSGRKLCRIVWTCKPDSDHYGPASEYNGDAGKYRNVLGHGNGIGTDQLPVAKELSENRRGHICHLHGPGNVRD